MTFMIAQRGAAVDPSGVTVDPANGRFICADPGFVGTGPRVNVSDDTSLHVRSLRQTTGSVPWSTTLRRHVTILGNTPTVSSA